MPTKTTHLISRAYRARNARREAVLTVVQIFTLMKSYHFITVCFSDTSSCLFSALHGKSTYECDTLLYHITLWVLWEQLGCACSDLPTELTGLLF